MNIAQHPDLLDRLASAHALGTLRGGARRRFETLARQRPTVRAAALLWQERVAGLTELQAPATPSPHVWTRVHNLVQADLAQRRQNRQSTTAPHTTEPVFNGGWWRSLALWRSLSIGGAVALTLGVSTGLGVYEMMNAQVNNLTARLQQAPRIEYVAVLQDGKTGPALLVTLDVQKQQLKLQRVGGYQEAADRSLQLWALPPGGAPRSLGVLGRDKLERLVTAPDAVSTVPTLAVSLEPKGGVPSEGGPTGPVLFTGAVIRNLL